MIESLILLSVSFRLLVTTGWLLGVKESRETSERYLIFCYISTKDHCHCVQKC